MTGENQRANAEAEVAKGKVALSAANALFGLGLYDDAMSRLYYAAFHFASAALLLEGVEVTSHRALVGLVSLHLVKPGHLGSATTRALSNLMSLRHQADYNRHFTLDEAGAREERARADTLLDELSAWIATKGISS